MKSKRIDNAVFVRLEPGDEITGQLMEVIAQYDIKVGRVSGIGACNMVTIGNFDLASRNYYKETKEGSFEIVSLAGNISRIGNEPYLHLHIILGDREMRLWGGHLNYGRISATAEIIIDIHEGKLDRFKDEDLGLNLWKL